MALLQVDRMRSSECDASTIILEVLMKPSNRSFACAINLASPTLIHSSIKIMSGSTSVVIANANRINIPLEYVLSGIDK